MAMHVQRHFLGWDTPALHSVVEYLERAYRVQDGQEWLLRDVTLVMPLGRALRRLEELLVQRAEKRGVRLIPPRMVTVGGLGELLFPSAEPAADDLTRVLTWSEALREVGAAKLIPQRPPADDHLGWMALGKMLDGIHTELAGEQRDFSDVASQAEEMGLEDQAQRWRAAEHVSRAYFQKLQAMNLVDGHAAMREAVLHSEPTEGGAIVILAQDLTALQCAMLAKVSSRVTSLIFAPDAMADRFDDYGNVICKQWSERPIVIAPQQMMIADRPSDQADAVVATMAEYGGSFSADQISLGVADESLVSYLRQPLAMRGVETRNTFGTPVTRSGVYQFFVAAADYLEQERFSDLATLLRHPDVERWVYKHVGETAALREGVSDWYTLMDRYYNDHLHGRLTEAWLGKVEYRDNLAKVHGAVEALLQPLRAEARAINKWASPMGQIIVQLYSDLKLDVDAEESHRVLVESCQAIQSVLQRLETLPPAIAPEVSASVALRMLLQSLHAQRVAPVNEGPAVEILGWLELSLDDAPALIVTGFNEGLIPESMKADAFLPNTMRSRLGMRDDARRYARDAYLLSAILASRPHVKLIAGRWTAVGEPLTPSRLMLACDSKDLPDRVQHFYRSTEQVAARAVPWPVANESGFHAPPALEIPVQTIRLMHVTWFRDYIACPYRFYLGHVLKLQHMDDQAEELDGGKFGDLIHDVLKQFGTSDVKNATDAETIRQFLHTALTQTASRRYGKSPSAAVRVQVELVRGRLDCFADVQAAHASAGWRIAEVEMDFRTQPMQFEVEGQVMQITGRIDRIDRHSVTGQYMILDYKSSDKETTPEKSHQQDEQWVDLQLPLYQLLAASRGIDASSMGYMLLPRDPKKCGIVAATWNEQDLSQARQAAEQVVRGVLNGQYPMVPEPPEFDDFADICGVGRWVSAVHEEEGEGL